MPFQDFIKKTDIWFTFNTFSLYPVEKGKMWWQHMNIFCSQFYRGSLNSYSIRIGCSLRSWLKPCHPICWPHVCEWDSIVFHVGKLSQDRYIFSLLATNVKQYCFFNMQWNFVVFSEACFDHESHHGLTQEKLKKTENHIQYFYLSFITKVEKI